MDAFMDEFMEAMNDVFPKILVQFEDFSTEHAFHYLEKYQKGAKIPVFNDDIQGTGAVMPFTTLLDASPNHFRNRSYCPVSSMPPNCLAMRLDDPSPTTVSSSWELVLQASVSRSR